MREFWRNVCFVGRLLRDLIRSAFGVIVILCLSGCMNVWSRSAKPYLCARHPYYCTAVAWTDCVCAPLHIGNSNDPIWTSLATLTWPFWVVDEVAEVAIDTVFLPVDGIYAICKDKPNQPKGKDEKVQEVR